MTTLKGSSKFRYDSEQGVVRTVLSCQSAGIGRVVKHFDWYCLLGLHISVIFLFHVGLIPEEAMSKTSSWSFPWNDMRIITLLTLFQLTFNCMQVYKRYVKLHRLTVRLLRNVVKLTWQCRFFCGRAAPQYVALSGRYHLAAATVFLESQKFKPSQSQEALFQGLSTHLLSDDEKAYLKEFELEHRSLLLTQWCADVIKEGFAKAHANEFELNSLKRDANVKACLMKIDRCLNYQQQITALKALPTPFQVYHLMNMMVLVNISMWAYFMGITFAWSSTFAFIGASLIFMNTERVAKRLQEPFGEHYRLDFPLNEWCTDCWMCVRTILKVQTGPFAQSARTRSPGSSKADERFRSCDLEVTPASVTQSVFQTLLGSSKSSANLDEQEMDFSNHWDSKAREEEVPTVQPWNRSRPLRNDGFGLGTAQGGEYVALAPGGIDSYKTYMNSDLEYGNPGSAVPVTMQLSHASTEETASHSSRPLLSIQQL